MKYRIYLYTLILLLFLLWCENRDNGKNIIMVNGDRIKVEVADTPGERSIGLSFRDSLPLNHGILFVFPDEARREFWMYKCKFDIDLAYIDGSGVITEIITMKKEPFNRPLDSLTVYYSTSSRIKYVLEIMGGWFQEHNIREGTRIDLRRFKASY